MDLNPLFNPFSFLLVCFCSSVSIYILYLLYVILCFLSISFSLLVTGKNANSNIYNDAYYCKLVAITLYKTSGLRQTAPNDKYMKNHSLKNLKILYLQLTP